MNSEWGCVRVQVTEVTGSTQERKVGYRSARWVTGAWSESQHETLLEAWGENVCVCVGRTKGVEAGTKGGYQEALGRRMETLCIQAAGWQLLAHVGGHCEEDLGASWL